MSNFKKDDIILLIGAGASVDARIPASEQMIQHLEEKLLGDWQEFRDLYNLIRSAIYYGDGVGGRFDHKVVFNIERLVNALDELDKKTEHPLYPFIGSWNTRLLELGGVGFELIAQLKNKILVELTERWLKPDYWVQASYYKGIENFIKGGGSVQKGYSFPLRVFSLNYDLCVEETCKDVRIERGFSREEARAWDWRLFDDNEDDPKDIFLYKLHGSIDWQRNVDGTTIYLDNYPKIKIGQLAIIFGTNYKLQYLDPFLFFAYEFRRWSLESRLVVAVGYGFGDEHINGILGQALMLSRERKLLAIAPCNIEEKRQEIASALKIQKSEQIVVWNYSAKEFFSTQFNVDRLQELFPVEENLFGEFQVDL